VSSSYDFENSAFSRVFFVVLYKHLASRLAFVEQDGRMIRLDEILNISMWKALQDSLSAMTGMTVVTADFAGNIVIERSGIQPFCAKMRSDATLVEYCKKFDAHSGFEAACLKKPYVYQCYNSIVNVAIPIIFNDIYVGSIFIGEVLLSDEKDYELLECVYPISRKHPLIEESMYLKALLPVMSLDKIQAVADLVFHLCNYLAEESIERNALMQLLIDGGSGNLKVDTLAQNGLPNRERLEKLRGSISNAMAVTLASDVPDDAEAKGTCRLLDPALAYIKEHMSERCALAQMAELCHISPGYFSRLFCKETGKNYSTFLQKKRIECSRKLLEATDLHIADIAEDVGFSDSAHFINTFKKYEGITPANYRRLFNSQR
jgi:AraC-like DNA-binding protein/ligand-binding sensor protein